MTSRNGRTKIKAPRKGILNSSSDADFEHTWSQVEECLTQMHNKCASNLSFEVVYRFAYKIVLKKMGEPFYRRFTHFERAWLSKSVRPTLEKLCPDQLIAPSDHVSAAYRRDAGNRLLKGLADAFRDHQQVMNMTTDVFMYLDRVFCSDNRYPQIYPLAMLLFKEEILRTRIRNGEGPTLQTIMVNVILDLIAMDRDGDIVDNSQIKACVFMLEGLHETVEEKEIERLYRTVFEPRFLETSRDFYKKEAEELMRQSNTPTYAKKTLNRIYEEEERCRSTLAAPSKAGIVAIVEEQLIKDRMSDLINSETGLASMIEHKKYDELAQIYNLNSRVDNKKNALCSALTKQIYQLGRATNRAAMESTSNRAEKIHQAKESDMAEDGNVKKKPAERVVSQQTAAAVQWVDAVLALKDKFDVIWTSSFMADNMVQPSITSSITEFINELKRAPEFVSLYIDDILKSTAKNRTEQEVDATLEKAIVVIQFLVDKDLFESYYKKHLCRRLIMKKTIGMDYEKQMAQRMRATLGKNFTHKMERMFGDMTISEDLSDRYTKMMEQSSEGERAELSLMVLADSIWPLEMVNGPASDNADDKLECIYPPEIERIKQSFAQFYGSIHSGRKITWCSNMGHADIRGVFPRVAGKSGALENERRYDFNVPTYSMLILLLFNDLPDGKSLTFDEIQKHTNIPTDVLKRNLQSLCLNKKTNILLRGGSKGPDIGSGDKFRVNDAFFSQFKKFKVGLIAAPNKVENDKERRDTEEKNDADRTFAIEAALVRIMKQRKTLGHAQLISETIAILTPIFKPNVQMIKQRIDGLIEREYIDRSPEDNSTYVYLA